MATLTIIRGIPGSGKSTLAKKLVSETRASWSEADMFFVGVDGTYSFDPKRIKEAHAWCQLKIREALKAGHDAVVSNTFTKIWEVQPYLDMAEDYSVKVVILHAIGKYASTHGVPIDVINRMRSAYEPLEGERYA